MKQKYFFLLCIVLCLTACLDSKENAKTSISGEIFNPQSSFVVLLRNDKTIDTVDLDENNRFYYQFDNNIEEGLYTILHDYNTHYETQMFYLERGEELQLRLNTQEFDESLMYSGEGAVANNFLMLLFLESMQSNKLLLDYYKISPETFLHKADSIKGEYVEDLKSLYQKRQVSQKFKDLADEIIDYAYFNTKERYYFLINKYRRSVLKDLPKDFLAYRETANFNHKDLQKYYIYQHFLDDYLKNKAVEECQELNKEKNCFDLQSRFNLEERMKMADSLFKLETLRERFLRDFSGWLIVSSKTEEEVDSTLQFLTKANFDEEEYNKVKKLAEVQKRQFIGNIGDLTLTSQKDEHVDIFTIINQPTVFYYWSLYYKSHHINLHEKIRNFEQKYPEINFVGINIDNEEADFTDQNAWKTSLANFEYTKFNEYQLVYPPEQRIFYRNYLNKAVFVDTDGQVIDNDLNIQDPSFEEDILGLLNR